ncbi:BZ3500_MvSof-1268-A1-R1_Chr4-2g07197 [Microbotryum saponariae]|uniref:BZ3500_MvSof-1268-A1-R1_Chr4-2g07197 protein n=1 Tax=Microbotryum saponariae TaxID=289078 RepID=A0A2X0KU20_9BASI|nr:BZ3500_MvSof-1268-A1-R1_Chr4-2g07197 [Microbotryum saponariae]SDA06862.1 BZ3501_MvSof-1269-A2-R1_Chr4-2g06908 [Microbotryum saponariae]
MGNSASKAAKQLTKTATAQSPLSSTGAAPTRSSPSSSSTFTPPSSSRSSRSSGPLASETKSDAIVHDSQDPNFMRKLEQLGQVKVPSAGFAFRADNQMLDILKQRKEQELQSESLTPIRNRIGARSLSNLLDDCKQAASKQEMQELCELYQIDYGHEIRSAQILTELNRHITSPSTSTIPLPERTVEEDDGETLLAIWVDAGGDPQKAAAPKKLAA